MPRGKTSGGKPPKRPIERYEHSDKKRINNPPVGLVTPETDPVAPTHKTYDYVAPVPSVKPRQELDYDPHLDPQLVWAGKKEHSSFEVPTVSLHVHERIDPHTIIDAVRKRNGNGLPVQPSLFERREAHRFVEGRYACCQAGTSGQRPDNRRFMKPLGYMPRRSARTIWATAMNTCPRSTASTNSMEFSITSTPWRNRMRATIPRGPCSSERFGPRNIVDCKATNVDDPTTDPRWGKVGKQTIADGGPLPPHPNMDPAAKTNMEDIEPELIRRSNDFMDRSVKAGKPFFLWHNSTRTHVWTHLAPKWQDKSGFGLYADAMMELDWEVGEILKKIDDLGIADNTIVLFTSDNGAEIFTWPDGGNHPFRGEKGTTYEGGFRVPMLVKWPGVIKPRTIINDIMSAEDWMPTLLAAAGDPDITESS